MAALFATTGKALLPKSSEAPFGNYLTGPKVITRDTLPSDTQQLCESESFPVCNGDGESFTSRLGNRCKCTDRGQIRIGIVLTDSGPGFWEPVWEGAYQAAKDMGVKLLIGTIDRSEGVASDSARLAAKVRVSALLFAMHISVTGAFFVSVLTTCVASFLSLFVKMVWMVSSQQ
jgi:hypothetical protein